MCAEYSNLETENGVETFRLLLVKSGCSPLRIGKIVV